MNDISSSELCIQRRGVSAYFITFRFYSPFICACRLIFENKINYVDDDNDDDDANDDDDDYNDNDEL